MLRATSRILLTDGQGRAPMPSLVLNGVWFETAAGEPWVWKMVDGYNLLGRYLAGENIDPFLRQVSSLGYNIIRVWTWFSIDGIGRCMVQDHPELYDRIPAFLAKCASFGLHVEFTAITGAEFADDGHWDRLNEARRRSPYRTLGELTNEGDQPKNRRDLSIYRKPADLWCSHGSNGSQAWPIHDPLNPWDYAGYHDNSAPEWWRKSGHEIGEIQGAYHIALITGEQTRWDQDPTLSHHEDSAAGMAFFGNGGCYHSPRGKTAEVMDGDELEGAKAFIKGFSRVELRFRYGQYRHAQERETPLILRSYEKRLGAEVAYLDVGY